MDLYSVYKQDTDSHALLIGMPLALVMLFCFAYIMLLSRSGQPYQAASSKAVSSNTQPTADLPAAHFTQESGLIPVDTSGSPSDSGSGGSPTQTSTADSSSSGVAASGQKPTHNKDQSRTPKNSAAANAAKANSSNPLAALLHKVL